MALLKVCICLQRAHPFHYAYSPCCPATTPNGHIRKCHTVVTQREVIIKGFGDNADCVLICLLGLFVLP